MDSGHDDPSGYGRHGRPRWMRGRTEGKSAAALPLIERKERLRALFARPIRGLRFSDSVREQ